MPNALHRLFLVGSLRVIFVRSRNIWRKFLEGLSWDGPNFAKREGVLAVFFETVRQKITTFAHTKIHPERFQKMSISSVRGYDSF